MATRKTKTIEGNPGALPALIAARDVEKVRAGLIDKYGDEISDRMAADLIAFVDMLTQQEIARALAGANPCRCVR